VPGHIVLDVDPVGTQPPIAAPPTFRSMSIVAKRSLISSTAELLQRFNFFLLCSTCMFVPSLDLALHLKLRMSTYNKW